MCLEKGNVDALSLNILHKDVRYYFKDNVGKLFSKVHRFFLTRAGGNVMVENLENVKGILINTLFRLLFLEGII